MAGCPNTTCNKFVYSIQISQLLNNKFDKGYRHSFGRFISIKIDFKLIYIFSLIK